MNMLIYTVKIYKIFCVPNLCLKVRERLSILGGLQDVTGSLQRMLRIGWESPVFGVCLSVYMYLPSH